MASRDQLYEALRQADAAGDTEAANHFADMLRALPKDAPAVTPEAVGEPSAPAPATPAPVSEPVPIPMDNPMVAQTPEPSPQSISEDQLRADPDWIAASRILYDMSHPTSAQRERLQPSSGQTELPEDTSDRAMADYGLDEIGWFNTNLVQMTDKSATILHATPEQQKAMLYLMDNSSNLGWSWEGSGRLFRGLATDPATYLGVASFGFGTVAAEGGKLLSKEGLKLALRSAVNMGVKAAIDGAIYNSVSNVGHQTVSIAAGAQEGMDYGQLGQAAGTGAVVGFGLGTVIGGAAHTAGTHVANGKIAEAEAVFGTAPPAAPAVAAATPNAAAATPDVSLTAAANENLKPIQPGAGAPEHGLAANSNILPEAPVANAATPNLAAKMPEDMAPANTVAVNENTKGLVGPALGAQTHLNTIIDAIKTLAPDGPIRVVNGVQGMKALGAATHGISQMIEMASRLGDGASLGDALLRSNVTAPQLQVLKHSAQQANDTLLREIVKTIETAKLTTTSKAEGIALRQRVDFLEQTRGAVQRLDSELATQSGRDLRMRQEGLNAAEVKDLSVQSLMENSNLSRKQAENAFLFEVGKREKVLTNKVELTALDQRLAIATQAKDFPLVSALKAERKTILGRTTEVVAPKGPIGNAYAKFNKAVDLVNEVVISNVFSLSTLIINTVPSYAKILTKPFANYIAKGATDGAAFRGMLASYGALHSMTGTAFKAALLAFKYEKSILLHNSESEFFASGIIPKKWGGGIVRFLPRLLNAQDEFMSQIAYRSYGVGEATANAISDAATKGLTGKASDDFVKQAVKDATDRLYNAEPGTDDHILDMLLDEAQSRGLGGEKANKWVANELNRNSKLLKQAQNQSGKDYVKDLLFKREFSGKSPASQLAKGYEQFVQKNPIMKVVGQLFFRTPIRVFEEGIRITPGLNLVTPGFMKDLAGGNGINRQVKAQGEALLSYGVFGSVMGLFASGAITGGGPTDFRQRRQGEDAGFEPYTVTFPNGDKWSYRNLDPIATPMKIIVNALERIKVLQYREAQGETPDQNELDKAMSYIGAGVGAIAQSFQDANLTQGVDNVVSFVGSLNDPRSGSMGDQGIKALGGYLALAVPNSWTKARMEFGGEAFQNDPITLEQVLRAKINPQDPLVPRQYNAVGSPRTLSNPEAGLYIFNASTPEERERGLPLAEREVEQELWTISQVADTDFTAPYRTALLPSVPDLRKVYTKDGKATYYDRWQSYVHDSDVVAQLDRVRTSELPYGTPGDSPRATAVNSILNQYRKAAMFRLIREEVGGFQDMQDTQIEQMLQRQSTNLNVPFN